MRKISRQLGAYISLLKKGIDEAVDEAEAALDNKAERDGPGDFSIDNLREAWAQLDPGQVKGLKKLQKERNGSQEHIREELRLIILALDQLDGKDAKKYRERMAQALQWQAEIDDIAAETDQLQTRVEWLKEMESEMEKQKILLSGKC
ncbi:hypothetical protein BDN70DRAFT_900320 [Pholiota conissans]|uniref:Uncharacterized protein n=1 Tax=Pholiota conissans TaxID=109636 RepID=A0A9P5YQ82_9AGAR|nr:hypothetical protein BDN70DRAFT_900320 [Pholiota conissans]